MLRKEREGMRIIIDKPLTGWEGIREPDLLGKYSEILKVGQYPGIPQRTDDKELGAYCRDNDCDFMTCDLKAYTHFLENDVKAVRVSKYGYNARSEQYVYLIEIVKS